MLWLRTVHLFQRSDHVGTVGKRHKTVAFGFVVPLLADNLGPLKALETAKSKVERFVVHLVAEVAHEDSVVTCSREVAV